MAKKKLVFIHGFLENASMWQYILPSLSVKEYAVHTPELPGHGANTFIPSEKTAESYCGNILEQLSLTEEDSVFIIGHSMGGYLSSTLAAMIPGNIRGLCLFHSKAGKDNEQKIEERRRAIKAAEENKGLYVQTMITGCFHEKNRARCAADMAKMIAEAKELSLEAITGAQQVMISRPDRIDTMRERKFPLYYFLGENDASIPLDIVKKEMEELPGAVSEVIPGIAHMGHIESTRSAIDFIQRIIRADL